jgi:hypothetical protein
MRIPRLTIRRMTIAGMGPVDPMRSTPGKLFSMLSAFFSGVALLTMMAVLLAPIIHRLLHKFHLAATDDDQADEAARTSGRSCQ